MRSLDAYDLASLGVLLVGGIAAALKQDDAASFAKALEADQNLGADPAEAFGQLLIGAAPAAGFAAQVTRDRGVGRHQIGQGIAHQLAHFERSWNSVVQPIELKPKRIELSANLIDQLHRRSGQRGPLAFQPQFGPPDQ